MSIVKILKNSFSVEHICKFIHIYCFILYCYVYYSRNFFRANKESRLFYFPIDCSIFPNHRFANNKIFFYKIIILVCMIVIFNITYIIFERQEWKFAISLILSCKYYFLIFKWFKHGFITSLQPPVVLLYPSHITSNNCLHLQCIYIYNKIMQNYTIIINFTLWISAVLYSVYKFSISTNSCKYHIINN